MFKLQILMNEEKILREREIDLNKVYKAIDEICEESHLTKEKTEEDGTLNYAGYNDCYAFGNCCIAIRHLKGNEWFKPNCSKWLFIEQHNGGEPDIDDMLVDDD